MSFPTDALPVQRLAVRDDNEELGDPIDRFIPDSPLPNKRLVDGRDTAWAQRWNAVGYGLIPNSDVHVSHATLKEAEKDLMENMNIETSVPLEARGRKNIFAAASVHKVTFKTEGLSYQSRKKDSINLTDADGTVLTFGPMRRKGTYVVKAAEDDGICRNNPVAFGDAQSSIFDCVQLTVMGDNLDDPLIRNPNSLLQHVTNGFVHGTDIVALASITGYDEKEIMLCRN